MAAKMNKEIHKVVHYLKYNDTLSLLDAWKLNIVDIERVVQKAINQGYNIQKKKVNGAIWNKNTVYYMETTK
jgi:uncharacterized protein YcgL (UPF0745 family)